MHVELHLTATVALSGAGSAHAPVFLTSVVTVEAGCCARPSGLSSSLTEFSLMSQFPRASCTRWYCSTE